MADYIAAARTNYFQVTDENRYQQLFKTLCSESSIEDFTKSCDGETYHAFGAYGTIDTDENSLDPFLKELQKILPDKEAFLYFESGHEKLRYVSGFAIVCTSKEIRYLTLDRLAKTEAKRLLGNDFSTQTEY